MKRLIGMLLLLSFLFGAVALAEEASTEYDYAQIWQSFGANSSEEM